MRFVLSASPLPHPLYDDPDELDVCVIVKDPPRDMKTQFEKDDVKVAKVIGLTKLRKRYRTFEARRQLCASYDMFIADSRIMEMLAKSLGKTFFSKHKFLILQ